MAADFQTIRVEREHTFAVVALARPEARNALNAAAIAELTAVFQDLGRDARLRAVVLIGDGPAFCAGADAAWMKEAGSLSAAENEADARRLSAMFEAWPHVPCPTLCLAHGAALGGGAGFVAAADVAVAEAGCRFGFTEVRLGLIPAVIFSSSSRRSGPTGRRGTSSRARASTRSARRSSASCRRSPPPERGAPGSIGSAPTSSRRARRPRARRRRCFAGTAPDRALRPAPTTSPGPSRASAEEPRRAKA